MVWTNSSSRTHPRKRRFAQHGRDRPMPVNAIGPKVYLNPGSVSVAVDCLYKNGFVSRVECSEDRRVRSASSITRTRCWINDPDILIGIESVDDFLELLDHYRA